MFIRAFFVLGWGGEQFGAGSSFTPSESYMLQIVGVLSANQSFFSSAHIPKSFFLSWQLFFCFSYTEYAFWKEYMSLWVFWCILYYPFFCHCLCKPELGGCGEKEQRIGCMCKLWMEQMGFMKITVGRINRTDDSRCQSIHANTF